MRGRPPSRAGALAALLACLAAVLAGAAAPAAAPLDPRLAAFLAAGGALDDICGEAGHGAAGDRHCDACVLLGPALPPEPGPAAPVDPRLAAFLAAGGTPGDICGEAGHGAGGERHCDACLLLGPALAPEPVRPAPVRTAGAAAPGADAPVPSRARPHAANQPRAPPLRS